MEILFYGKGQFGKCIKVFMPKIISRKEFHVMKRLTTLEKQNNPSLKEMDVLSKEIEKAIHLSPSDLLFAEQERLFSLARRCHNLSIEKKIKGTISIINQLLKNQKTPFSKKAKARMLYQQLIHLMEDPSLSKEQILELSKIAKVLSVNYKIKCKLIDSVIIQEKIDLDPYDIGEQTVLLMELAHLLYEHKISEFYKVYNSILPAVHHLLHLYMTRRGCCLEVLLQPKLHKTFEVSLSAIIESFFRCASHLARGEDFGIYPSQEKIETSFTPKWPQETPFKQCKVSVRL